MVIETQCYRPSSITINYIKRGKMGTKNEQLLVTDGILTLLIVQNVAVSFMDKAESRYLGNPLSLSSRSSQNTNLK